MNSYLNYTDYTNKQQLEMLTQMINHMLLMLKLEPNGMLGMKTKECQMMMLKPHTVNLLKKCSMNANDSVFKTCKIVINRFSLKIRIS